MSACFSGKLFEQIEGNYGLRMSIYTLAAELHPPGQDLLTQVLEEAVKLTELEGRQDPTLGRIQTPVAKVQRKLRNYLWMGIVSKEAFGEAVRSWTSVGEQSVDSIFDLVDDGSSHAMVQDLRSLLCSAAGAIPKLRQSTRASTILSRLNTLRAKSVDSTGTVSMGNDDNSSNDQDADADSDENSAGPDATCTSHEEDDDQEVQQFASKSCQDQEASSEQKAHTSTTSYPKASL
eukprot:TRINITY_DN31056_c0_g2_i3.p1 TRINITY_DN31056_c0_g2~~TRINITY_DN31056_c0_g2_i3.p1  ORF type:complete len:256 (-),score=58.56 TRINITY_DN31056_c0_g2_i3:576-1277(-)